MAASGAAEARDDARPRGTHSTQPHTRTTERQCTENGPRRSDTMAREANYSTAGGRSGSGSDVIQRTEVGYSRNTPHTTPDGATHTRDVDVSCDKDAQKCVRQVDVGQQP
jgi:hypothetical protein